MRARNADPENNNLVVGLVILIIGTILLLKQLGIIVPGWMLSWPMIFIGLGIAILIKQRFRSGFGAFMVLFGLFFLIKTEFNLPIQIERYLIPIGLIVLGLYIILNRKGKSGNHWNDPGHMNFLNKDPFSNPFSGNIPDPEKKTAFSGNPEDFLHSQAFFCGVQKRVLTKKFKGGQTTTLFGSTEIDLSQAGLAENAVLDVEVAFGGLKLIVPAHWELQIGVENWFAGIEDKRMYPQKVSSEPLNVLKVKGKVIFGGLEIKSV